MKKLVVALSAFLQRRRDLTISVAIVLAIALAFGGRSQASETHAAPVQPHHTMQTNKEMNPQMPYCSFSQIWVSSTIIRPPGQNAQPLYRCDGLYVNCWATNPNGLPGVGGDNWYEWVSWTSRYGYVYQGWVDDYSIETSNNPPWVYWNPC